MSNRELPMMPWYPQDFASATSAYTFVERALYRELLDAQWILGKLPTDLKRLARIAKCDQADFDEAWPTVSQKFMEVNGCFQNKRLEEHRRKALSLVQQRRTAAQASADARHERALQRSSDARSTSASASREHPSPSSSPYKTQSGTGVTHPPGAGARNGSGQKSAAWTQLKTRAKAAGFREPFDADTLETYETALKLHERDQPRP